MEYSLLSNLHSVEILYNYTYDTMKQCYCKLISIYNYILIFIKCNKQ